MGSSRSSSPSSSTPPPTPTPAPKKRGRGRPPRQAAASVASKCSDPPRQEAVPTVSQPATVSGLLAQGRETVDEWFKAKRTTKQYRSTVSSGKQWLKNWLENAVGEGDGAVTETVDRPEDMLRAFDELNEYTPVALLMLTTFKCETQEKPCKFATAQNIRSAFKDYFERVFLCQGDYWRHNEHTNQWEGNPVFQYQYKTYYESLNNKDRSAITVQAKAMLPDDLRILFEMSAKPQKYGLTNPPYLRCDELLTLKAQAIRPQSSATGIPYLEVTLVFRKTNNDANKAQMYKICQEPGNPVYLDCYTHLKTWLEYLQKHTPRQILPSDPLFPAMASTGKLKIGEQMSKTGFDRLLEQVVEESDVLDGRPGKFTTHCFRRGGCQYRFMWVENPWSLKAVKWWGGWSSNDSVGTIMRYLLDELTAYKDDYGDIMMPDRPLNRRETLMGRYAPATPSSSTEIKELRECVQNLTQIIMQTPERLGTMHTPIQKQSASLYDTTPIPMPQCYPPAVSYQPQEFQEPITPTYQPPRHFQHPTPISVVRTTTITTGSQAIPEVSSSQARTTPTTTGSQAIPDVSSQRIPACKSLKMALEYWNCGCPYNGLVVPLSQWDEKYDLKSISQSEKIKYYNIRSVVDEIEEEHGGDEASFCQQYGDLVHCWKGLYEAVRKYKQSNGRAKVRQRGPSKRSRR
ncbi:hypothetical protein BJ912DRAFT_931306 [Pholiota molesta]|nr:hypothetical protein BJ912DRAFT_931306 [Pholiota molesta]